MTPYPARGAARVYSSPVFELIQADLQRFEVRLAEMVRSSVGFIEAIGAELVSAGGKRLRPSLAFLAGRVLGAEADASLTVALAVEMLHSASLLHDDLIDDADTRRGREAAFRRYGNVVSVMSGDYLLAKVLSLLADADNADFTRLMSSAAAQICEGEVLQFEMATLESFTFANYRRVIEGKTAALFAAALEGVALLADAPEPQRRALHAYGMAYGRAFQMRDDYLDLLGDERVLGKPVGGDLREGKATYPTLVLLARGVEEARAILRRHAQNEGDVARLIALVREHGADTETRIQIEAEAEMAVAALAALPDHPAKAHLIELARAEVVRLS